MLRPGRNLSGLLFALVIFSRPSIAEELKIAVAANFQETMQQLIPLFEKEKEYKITAAYGATAKFYLQLRHGAPFEIFLAADAEHPRLLEAEKLGLPATRFTYAIGSLVLWSPVAGITDAGAASFRNPKIKHIAVANPEIAPYGRAAHAYMTALQVWEPLKPRMVMGQDVGQAYQFVASGNAEMGFIALSQISGPARQPRGSFYIVPQKYYDPLIQQAIQMRRTNAARDFMEFLKSPRARKIIQQFGYAVP